MLAKLNACVVDDQPFLTVKFTRSVTPTYRPVSLTSQICKLFEAVVRNEILKFLDKHEMIKDSQRGFRKGRSCLTNLLLFLDQVLKSVDKGHCGYGIRRFGKGIRISVY